MERIYLIGFMGSGKTSTGRLLAERLGFGFVDMDDLIVETAGMSIPEIFSRFGEDRFRDIETEVLKRVAGESNRVISCGGGVIIREENRRVLKNTGKVVYLRTSPEVAYERIKGDANRPLIQVPDPLAKIRELMERRRKWYEETAHLAVDTDGKTPSEVAEEVLNALRDR